MNKIYDQWLKSDKLTKNEKDELTKLSPEEIESYFSEQPLVFGTAGVRGKMGMGTQRMNRFTYGQLASAYALYIQAKFTNPQVVIGHDNRRDSNKFAELCADILSSYGIKVLLFKHNHLMPTPIISYAIRQTKSSGGIIITASHNPKEYNGFKIYNPDGGQVLPKTVDEITINFERQDNIINYKFHANRNLISQIDNEIIKHYFDDAHSALVNNGFISIKKDYQIVFTGHHGTSSKLLPKFLRSLKFNIKPVRSQCFYDTEFKNSPISNPETIDSFIASFTYADKIGSRICIGVDPDADRMAVAIKKNGKWRLMSGNEMGIIYTYYVLNNKKFSKKPYIISSYVSTYLIDRIAKFHDADVYRTGTGFKWMGALVTEIGDKKEFVVAFEEAIGALNSTINRDKDSFTASALALEIYHYYRLKNMDFVDILEQEIYPEFGWWFGRTDSFTFDSLEWKKIISEKMDMFVNYRHKVFANKKIKKIVWNTNGDCLDWLLENEEWIRFRKSGTEPKFKIYYNLYGESNQSLVSEYELLHKEFTKLLGV